MSLAAPAVFNCAGKVVLTGIGKAGARNAGLLAACILGRADGAIAAKVREQRERMVREVEAKDAALQVRLAGPEKK